MARDGYLSGVLADGARPFKYRAGIRELLGVPDDNGVRISFGPTPPRGGLRYRRQQDSPAPQPQVWDGGTRWLAETEDFEEQPAARPAPTRIDVPGVTERPPVFPPHDSPRLLDVTAVEPSASQVPVTSVWASESQAAQENPMRRDDDAAAAPVTVAIPPAIQPVRLVATPPEAGVSPARPTVLPSANPVPQTVPQTVTQTASTGAQHAVPQSPAPSPPRALDTPQWTSTSTPLLMSTLTPHRPTGAPAVADIESVRSVPTAAPERTTWSPDRSDGEMTAVQSIVNANQPRPQPSVLRPAVLDVPYRKPVDSVPMIAETSTPPVEQHSAPPPVPPRVVVVRAPAQVTEVPAFWERRQLGRLLNRIMR